MGNTVASGNTEKKVIDWIAIEKDYRAGIKSNRQIADEHTVSETAIRKRALKYDWAKDLSAKIRLRASELVRTQEVRNEVRSQIDDSQIVEDNAQVQATVIREHRGDIKHARSLVQTLLNQLDGSLVNKAEFEDLAEILATKRTAHIEDAYKREKEHERLVQIFTKFMQLPSQAGTVKQLTDSLKTLIALEREAFSIDEKVNTSKTLEDFLEEIAAK